MHRRRFLAAAAVATAGGVAGCSGQERQRTPAFATTSDALGGETLPARYTCDGEGVSPPIDIGRVPEPTAALAVTARSEGGPISDPMFWTLWNVPPDTAEIPAALPRQATVPSLGDARQGRLEGGEPGYRPPCPPKGATLEQQFQVYALGERLSVEGGATHDTATEAIQDATIASRRFTLDYTGAGGTPRSPGTDADR